MNKAAKFLLFGAVAAAGFACVVVLAILFAKVGGGPGSGTGAAALPITGKTPAGQAIDTRDWRGKVVVVDFWATWCPPCRESIPEMIALHKEFNGQGVEFLGVSADRGSAELTKYEQDHGIPYPSILEGAGEALKAWKVEGIPTVVVIDKAGIVRFRAHGGDIRGAIEGALKG